jgi:hypothetical protein
MQFGLQSSKDDSVITWHRLGTEGNSDGASTAEVEVRSTQNTKSRQEESKERARKRKERMKASKMCGKARNREKREHKGK